MTRIPPYRDVVCTTCGSVVLLTSLDAAAGIGPSSGDLVEADLADVAYFVCRTAVVELLCLNAPPFLLTIGTSLSASVAADLRRGIEQLFADLGIRLEVAMSHENYLRTTETAVVSTAFAWEKEAVLKCQPIEPGQLVFLHGGGYTRQGITRFDTDMPTLRDLVALTREPTVRQVVPVGSRGARHDLDTISDEYHVEFLGNLPESIRGGPGLQFLVIADAIPRAARCEPIGSFVAAQSTHHNQPR